MIRRLQWRSVRSLAEGELFAGSAGVVLTGSNGAGKTSVLEAIHVLGHGRSFRGRVVDGLIRRGDGCLSVFAEFQRKGETHRLGIQHFGDRWEGRIDGRALEVLTELVTSFPVLVFDPGVGALVSGPAEERRRFLDFLLFHVEPEFLPWWRRYNRALKQRNALLKQGGASGLFDGFEAEMAVAAVPLHRLREMAVERLVEHVEPMMRALSPAFPGCGLSLKPGWKREEQDLAELLYLHRDRDRDLGFTTMGPHRADLRIEVLGLSAGQLSRGQVKILCLALVFAQARAVQTGSSIAPVLLLDDLFAELDLDHGRRVLGVVAALGMQAWITSPSIPAALVDDLGGYARFHVEQGEILPQTLMGDPG